MKKDRINQQVTMKPRAPNLTLKVSLHGEQARVRELILYVSKSCQTARYFGAVKLNKILWKADFDSFAARQLPITGREYRRRYFGPALLEMLPIHKDMLREGLIEIEQRSYGNGFIEKRTVALVEPNLDKYFTATDMSFVDRSIRHYWELTGTEASDESHGAAWRTRRDNDPMPYDLALFSDEPLSLEKHLKIEDLIYEKGWISA